VVVDTLVSAAVNASKRRPSGAGEASANAAVRKHTLNFCILSQSALKAVALIVALQKCRL